MIGEICKSPHLDFMKKLKEKMGEKCKLYVEIGVLYGGSMILQMDMPFKCKHIGIDPFTGYYGKDYDPYRKINLQNHYDIVYENLTKNNPHNQEWELVKGKSEDVHETIPNNIDYLFIDGDHSFQGVMNDFINYKDKVSENGYIVFDNYNDNCWADVTKAVDKIVEDYKHQFTKECVYGHCLVLIKKS
jgi:hypothetical protein